MGWRPKDFWRAGLPEVMGAIVGDNNRQIEQLKLVWEPARFQAFIQWNTTVDKRHKLRHEQQLRKFPWEKRTIMQGEADKVRREVMKFRDVVKNKWGLKYLNE